MKQLIVICLCLIGRTQTAFAQNCNCDSTFKIVAYHIENNYAGWFGQKQAICTTLFVNDQYSS